MKIALSFSNIFKTKKIRKSLYSILNDETAIFSDFGEDVYLSDLVNNSIDRIATEVSKIDVISIINKDGTIKKLNDDLTRLFKFKPNPLQTTKDFLACCEWLRRKDYNCFIYPQYTEVTGRDGKTYKKYTALYPLNPTLVRFGVDDTGAVWEVEFTFKDGSSHVLLYSDIIHLRWRRGKNNIIGGGDDFGNPDTKNLLESIRILDKVMQGLPKSLEASLKITGIYTAKSIVDKDKLNKQRDDFESHIQTSKTGIVATDLAGEFTPVNPKVVQIDPEVLKLLKGIIRERYGVSAAIVSGDYNGEQHSAFYQTCIEDFIVEFEQACSSTLFTPTEQNFGHMIKCYYSRVAYMNNTDKIQLATIATNTALMRKDELREMFGMPAVGGEDGSKFIQSLNFVDEAISKEYQIGIKNRKGKGGNNEE